MFIQNPSLIYNSKKKIMLLSHTLRKTGRHEITNRIKLEHFSMKKVMKKQGEKESMCWVLQTRKNCLLVMPTKTLKGYSLRLFPSIWGF